MVTLIRFVILALVLGLGSVGCVAHVRGTATVSEPDLVLVDGGDVWVVENYDEPVFYTEGYYWRWYGSVWYRSSVHTGGWIQVSTVPASVQRIPRPEVYAHYTAPAGAQKRRGPPDHAPAHGVRGDEPGHAEEHGPPGPGHTPPGLENKQPGMGGPPPGKGPEEKGPPAGKGPEDKGPPPGKGPEEKGPPAGKGPGGDKGPPPKEEKATKGPPPKEDKGPPAKEDKGPPAKGDKGPPAKEDKDKGKKK